MRATELGPLPQLAVGDTLLAVTQRHFRSDSDVREVTVTKVGRRWGYASSGKRFDLTDGVEDAGPYTSDTRYMTQAMMDSQAERTRVLGLLRGHGITWDYRRSAGRHTTATLTAVLAALDQGAAEGTN